MEHPTSREGDGILGERSPEIAEYLPFHTYDRMPDVDDGRHTSEEADSSQPTVPESE